MESEEQKVPALRSEIEQPCPVCGRSTHVCTEQKKDDTANIFSQLYNSLYHQRICTSCNFTFSSMIVSDFFWSYFRPVLTPYFPRLGMRNHIPSYYEITSQETIPYLPEPPRLDKRKKTKPKKQVKSKRASTKPIPFSIDPINRTISINIQCALGEGKLSKEIEAAADSLEKNLLEAASQIRELVESKKLSRSSRSEAFSDETSRLQRR